MLLSHIKNNKKKYLFLITILLFWNTLNFPLFKDPTSTVLLTGRGELLAARIADDGQWRFPPSDSIPEKFKIAITHFEDQYFYYHIGVNPISILRALKQNLEKKEIISGGSTITMQTIRLSRKGKPRTYWEKFIEIVLSVRLEFSTSKQEILELYAHNAPFGGNVVGLDAASWRYYKRSPHELSWGEITTLAVLPNAPSLIYPGKNQEILFKKRNKLLDKLFQNNIIDSLTCELAKIEPLPGKPHPLPQITPHLLNRLIKDGYKGQICKVTINKHVQEKINTIVNRYHNHFHYNEIHNISVLILDVKKQEVVSYIGNSNCSYVNSGSKVDMITAKRSTGSILKPLLYASILDEGHRNPHSLVQDIPKQILSYSPKNFYRTYDGAVTASDALIRSLNIPSVIELNNYGQQKFYNKLRSLNLKSINKNANHYGLSLILGGAESTMWELGRTYMGMASILNNYEKNNYQYNIYAYNDPTIIINSKKEITLEKTSHFSVGSIWQTFEVLKELNRPINEGEWELFESSVKIAWKTGTSFGHKDAWSIGITPEYITVVWVGNSDGEGRPGLTGTSIAAPIMFDVFRTLPKTTWFNTPYYDLEEIEVCLESGDIPSQNCNNIKKELFPKNCTRAKQCQYHKIIHLNNDSTYRVHSECYSIDKIHSVSWFDLPPIMSYYYKKVNPFYETKPELHEACKNQLENNMQIIYPKNGSKIFLPRNLDGSKNQIIFKAVHKQSDATIYWHLNGNYIGFSKKNHNKMINTSLGIQKLTIVDENGNEKKIQFEIIDANQ